MGTDHRGPKLPSGLAGVLNAPEESRDSAYFSSTDASSKRKLALQLLEYLPDQTNLTLNRYIGSFWHWHQCLPPRKRDNSVADGYNPTPDCLSNRQHERGIDGVPHSAGKPAL